MDEQDLVLLPRPRRIRARGGGPPKDAPVRILQDRSLPPEGYAVRTTGGGVVIRHRDEAGLRYALALLAQIRSQWPKGLPALEVDDHPDMARRAFLLDVSRDRVPTRETLERLVGLLALARYNELQLYTEHTFAYRDHEEVWRDASPLTPEDVRWLDAHCTAAGIELVPNQNCFGHMQRWLRHPTYRWRAECPDGAEVIPGLVAPPSVLAPTSANAAFVLDLLAELLANFTSRRVHIGCDETFELGLGASRSAVQVRGRAAVWAEHVARIAAPLVAAGYEVQLWADVLRTDPEAARALPDGTVPVSWNYEAPGGADLPGEVTALLARLGLEPSAFRGFAANVAPLAAAGLRFRVAPGTSSWNSLVGRIDNATANIRDAVDVALAHGVDGICVTDWGDNGHIQPPPVSWPALAYGGAVAWCQEANWDLDLARVLDTHVFADPTGRLGGALLSAGTQWRRTGQRAFNASPLQAALFPHQAHLVVGHPDPAGVATVIETLDTALEAVGASAPAVSDGALVRRELSLALRLARLGARRLLGSPNPSAFRDEFAELAGEHRACWLARSRPGGLDDSLAHFRRALSRA